MRNLMLRIFMCCTLMTLLFLLYVSVKDYQILLYKFNYVRGVNEKSGQTTNHSAQFVEINKSGSKNSQKVDAPLKYILQWTSSKNVPFVYMGVGQEGFISRNCPYTNCFVTGDRNYLGDVTKFDVIAFAGPEVVRLSNARLPMARSPHQKYAFATIESSQYYPVCSNRFDGFFNWTWTFRLDSDVRWGYMVVKDANNNIVGPNKIMHWMKLEDMDPVSDELKESLKSKSKAAAWFVSNCFDRAGRMLFAKDLQKELQKYNHVLDIYGKCGSLSCTGDQEKCDKLLNDDYYFYLSFENSFSEDYATEKLTIALRNNIIPVVYGGANYSRDYRLKRYNVLMVNEKNENKYVEISVQTSYMRQVSPQLALENNITNKKEKPKLKYILQWTAADNVPFVYMGVGQEGFTSRHCPYTNCFVTDNKDLLGDITKFDVIAFAGPEVVFMSGYRLPMRRSPHQKYAFASIESSDNYPVCSNQFDGYFNWTWTYRLDSDVRWGYMLIKDANNNIVGPNKIMHWIKKEDMAPVSKEFKEKISSKNRAAAWFVSNCVDNSGRMIFAQELKIELKKYNHALDIYGECGPYSCPRNKSDECNKLLQDHYYFYLSFENSFSVDYATEKLRTALVNNVVPIVYGGANYSRFMPDGIYLNARELGVQKLAEKMDQLIKDKEEYANYFRWKKYYTYHRRAEFPETDEYCMFCTLLNNEEKLKRTEIVDNFRDWWDNPKTC